MRFATPLHRIVYYVLLVGLSVSVALILAGSIVALATTGSLPQRAVLWTQGLALALAGEAQGLVSVGLLGLLLTPLAAVAATVLVSAQRGDWTGVLAGVGVALVMVVSLLLGRE